ncbi:MAG: homocysteine S-methyltransferase family protein [Parasporobacterium sp.]|nr:homocysteine S-methyltransferase family protein [Parasporobacterium sp.]
MEREIFKAITQDRIMILDGAMGSNLLAQGMPMHGCGEEWICEHPSVVQNLQKQYLDAGSDFLYAATFGANRARLESQGLADQIERLNTVPVQLARGIATPGVHIVAGDVSMTTRDFDPDDEEEFREIIDIYKEQISILVKAGCEVLVVETMMNLDEARAAVLAAREVCDLPVMATLTFEENGMTLYGNKPEDAAKVLEEAGADAVGANCSTGPMKMLPVIERMADAVTLPIIAKPNAGVPQPGPNGTVKYDMSADEFAVSMAQLIEAGASLVGGCCGTTPDFIRKLSFLTQNMSFESRR